MTPFRLDGEAEGTFNNGRLGRSPYRHHAAPGGQGLCGRPESSTWPTGKRTKFSHGPRDNRDAGFNFDPQIIAVAEEVLLHRLDCLD